MALPVRCHVNLCHFTHMVGSELAQALLGSDLYMKQSLDEYLHQHQ